MDRSSHVVEEVFMWAFKLMIDNLRLFLVIQLVVVSSLWQLVWGLGSMASIAISYGENGSAFCALKSDGSHLVTCYGSNAAIIYGTPSHFPFLGLTAGDGFVCGLLMESNQPYCWGSSEYVKMGVPQPIVQDSEYSEISAGDYHICGLRKPLTGHRRNLSLVDCWGYNMTKNYVINGQIQSISAGSVFNCGLFSQNLTVFCWGDETTSHVIALIPREKRFRLIAAGGFHVCGISEGLESAAFCWGRSPDLETDVSLVYPAGGNIDLPPREALISVVGGRFHACGIKSYDHGVVCWGFLVKPSTPIPRNIKVYEIASGNYFTCGILAEKSFQPVCWGLGFPILLPLAVSPGTCTTSPCPHGFYESPCRNPSSHICIRCSNDCPIEKFQKTSCSVKSDRVCVYNCSSCFSANCFSHCSSWSSPGIGMANKKSNKKNKKLWPLQVPAILTEVGFMVFFASVVSVCGIVYVHRRLRNCKCMVKDSESKRSTKMAAGSTTCLPSEDDLKIRRAKMFAYEELRKATCGFSEESLVGRGSFSCVYKGVLRNGTAVAVKKAIVSSDQQKDSREFLNELDLLSRLNHAHLLNLLGYCEDGGERLLVYEFMSHGSLHQHLHGKNVAQRKQMDWVRRVTIAVQAARGIEYLHGYACPPVIHRDIKSSNILIDEDHNARVADFGLSLLGPADSASPLAEPPAGTLGYLDPEYYRLHYLTTKSDVYSFGVLLLEILSGRKAIDMKYEEDGNIVEWGVPLIKSGDVLAILDPVLNPPCDLEPLKKIANLACKCVQMRGKDRPSMDKVTTGLERALVQLMGNPLPHQPILPSEVVLGSNRLHKKPSLWSSNRSTSETDGAEGDDRRVEFRAPSCITFPSVTSSQRRKSSVSDSDRFDGKPMESRSLAHLTRMGEIGPAPASPHQNLFLQHNF